MAERKPSKTNRGPEVAAVDNVLDFESRKHAVEAEDPHDDSGEALMG